MKQLKRFIIIFLCISVLFSFTACKEKSNEPEAMTYKDVQSTKSLYSYWISTYKSRFLYNYNNGIDNESFWQSKTSDGMTYSDYVTEWVNNDVKYRTVAIKLFDEYNLKIDEDKLKSIDDDISEKQEYIGGRAELNATLAKFGMNVDMLRDVYIANAKYDAVYDYLFGSNGKYAPTDGEKAEYFKNNYYCIKYITIYSGAELKKDANGNYVYDSDGNIEIIALSDEQKKVKQQIIDTIVQGVSSGGDFDDYIKEFSEVDYSDYPNGFFVSKNDYSKFGSDIVNAAIELESGDVKKVSDENVTYIIKKCDLPEYNKLSASDKNQLNDLDESLIHEKQTAFFDSLIGDVWVNEEILSSFSIEKVSQNSYF